MFRDIIKNPQAVAGLIILFVILIFAVFAPFFSQNDPVDVNPVLKFKEASSDYPLGTDNLGRCVYSRLIHGARYSLFIAIPILFSLAFISIILGTITAYYGGLFDKILNVICNIFMAFPPLIVVLSLVSSLGQGMINIAVSIVISMWVWFVRVIRSYVLEEKNNQYVISARISGCSDFRIILKHIMPNVMPQIIVYFSTGISSIILMISGFAFLGIGIEKGLPEWGAMLSDGKSNLYSNPQLLIYPGLCILFTAAGFNLFGEALRDIISKEEG